MNISYLYIFGTALFAVSKLVGCCCKLSMSGIIRPSLSTGWSKGTVQHRTSHTMIIIFRPHRNTTHVDAVYIVTDRVA